MGPIAATAIIGVAANCAAPVTLKWLVSIAIHSASVLESQGRQRRLRTGGRKTWAFESPRRHYAQVVRNW